MKIKHHEIIPNKDNPFAECKLAREPYARVLTDIVNTYADGFVLAINNEWGTGKTTFVKMWQQQLKNEGFQTIYFNAWENDFDSNPLVALMSELGTLTNAKNKKVFKSVIEKGAVLAKNIVPAILKAIANKYIDSEAIADAIKNTSKAATGILEDEIKEYTSKKKTIIEFRKELEKFVKKSDNSKPLIFIVDELDRCRPNYAVEVLEQIKHFFSVPGIVFVLSIDKKHLAASVKGYYGSEHINTDEYLRRFIDLEYSIPKPQVRDAINYFMEYYSFSDFFMNERRRQHNELSTDMQHFAIMAEYLIDKAMITLRQQEKIFASTRLVLSAFHLEHYIFPHLLFVLVYFKNHQAEFYNELVNGKLTLQEVSDKFASFVHNPKYKNDRINLAHIEALLLTFYNNSLSIKDDSIFIESGDGKPRSYLKSGVASNDDELAIRLHKVASSNYYEYKINYLLDKINLTDPIFIEKQT